MNNSGKVITFTELSSSAITQIVFEAIMSILGVTGNIIIIVVILHTKRLRIVTNYFIISLCLVGLIIAACVIPIHILAEYKIDNQDFCLAAYTLILIFCMCSVLTLLAIATERYSAIVAPFSYVRWITHNRVLGCIVIIWITSSLTAVYPIVAHKTQPKDTNNTLCNFQNAVPKEGGIPCFCIMFVCILITSAMYIKIMAVARNQSRRIAALEVSDSVEERTHNVESAAIFHTSESVMDPSSSINGTRRRIKQVTYSEPKSMIFVSNDHSNGEAVCEIQMKILTAKKCDKSTNTDSESNFYHRITDTEIAYEYFRLMEIYHQEVRKKQRIVDAESVSGENHIAFDADMKNLNTCNASSEVEICGIHNDIATKDVTSGGSEIDTKSEIDCRMNNVYKFKGKSNVAVVEPFRTYTGRSKSEIDKSITSHKGVMRRRTDDGIQGQDGVLKGRTASCSNSAPKNVRYENALDRVRQRNGTALSDVEALFSISQFNEKRIKSNKSNLPVDKRRVLDKEQVPIAISKESGSIESMRRTTVPTENDDNDRQDDDNIGNNSKQGKWFLSSPNEDSDDDVASPKRVLPITKKDSLTVPEIEFPLHRHIATSGSGLHTICEISRPEPEPQICSARRTRKWSNKFIHTADQPDDKELKQSTLKRSLSVRERLSESFHNFQERRRSKRKEIKRARRERRTTLFLGAVILYFFVAYTPLLVTLSLFYYGIKPFNAITILAYLLIFTSCVVNPFIYGFGYKEYRKSLQDMLCKRRDRLASRMSSSD